MSNLKNNMNFTLFGTQTTNFGSSSAKIVKYYINTDLLYEFSLGWICLGRIYNETALFSRKTTVLALELPKMVVRVPKL